MNIVIPKEVVPGETRVAVIPGMLAMFVRDKHEVLIQAGAGAAASFSDEDYKAAGARIATDASSLYAHANVIIKVQPPTKSEAEQYPEQSTYIGYLAPLANAEIVKVFTARKITAYSMEYIPRITRAQSMDVLSSMATISGYKAVLLASDKLTKMVPLLMTAAGTIPPATVLVLGAGVAGLQAIATAKRLGAKVEAFDPRPAVKEQVKSLGASFVEMEMPKDAETAGGYAKELSAEFLKKEMEAIAARLPKVDVVICTAQVFGKRAPILVDKAMVAMMRRGSVIVDLAAEQGGNCAMTKAGETVDHKGVQIIGPVNVPAMLPIDASRMYSKNITTLFKLLYPKPEATPDENDEIVMGSCITRGGSIVNEQVRKALQ